MPATDPREIPSFKGQVLMVFTVYNTKQCGIIEVRTFPGLLPQQLGGLKHRSVFSRSSGDQRSEVKVSAWLVPS